jgi:hypothetical protein
MSEPNHLFTGPVKSASFSSKRQRLYLQSDCLGAENSEVSAVRVDLKHMLELSGRSSAPAEYGSLLAVSVGVDLAWVEIHNEQFSLICGSLN